jgi:hypothetical protein
MKVHFQGKNPIQLSERDFEIFRLIQFEGAKTSAEIEKRFWDGKSRKAKAAFQRLRRLVEAGLLVRGNPRFLYLTDHARNLLAQDARLWGKEVKQSA